jgi:hypothetical protein
MTDDEKDLAFSSLLRQLVALHGLERVQEMYDAGDPLIVGPFTRLRMTPRNADMLWRNVKREVRVERIRKARVEALKETPEIQALLKAVDDFFQESLLPSPDDGKAIRVLEELANARAEVAKLLDRD